MRHHSLSITWFALLLVTVNSARGDKVTFEDDATESHNDSGIGESPADQQPIPVNPANLNSTEGRGRHGKNLLDWIGLGTGQNTDPYLARTNEGCLNGDFAECFKSRALNTFSDFFDQNIYNLNENVKVIRMGRDLVQEVSRQPYEYVSQARSEESEWDHLVKFAMRKAERFLKTTAIEVNVPTWATGENEVYAPRFLDEIAEEVDILENKKDTLFSRHRFRKILIPMLIILKLFKIKLLLFLPLILGLASFKKFLGFLAIVIPGAIGFFKLCKPMTQSYTPPIYSTSGVGYPGGIYKESHPGFNPSHIEHHGPPPHEHHGGSSPHEHHGGSSYHPYRESSDNVNFGQELAYQGYHNYQK